jgi:DMSO reductase family type II enzyme heme b subunit
MQRTIFLALAFAVVLGASCQRQAVVTPEVVASRTANVPENPDDPVWQSAPEHVAALLLQDLVEPRLMNVSTPEVRVRALTNGSQIAFRLEWADAEVNDLPGAGRFADGCAVQLPQAADPTAPDPQMGQLGRGVQIAFWRADWQAVVDGRGDTLRDLYPNASIDHYPFNAPSLEAGSDAQAQMARRYAPADAVGNRRAGPRASPVEDLIAEGPGTITPAPATTSRGRGVRTPTGWAVVITRAVPAGLSPTSRTQIAFAVWQGAAQETGARKMRSGWVGLAMRETT